MSLEYEKTARLKRAVFFPKNHSFWYEQSFAKQTAISSLFWCDQSFTILQKTAHLGTWMSSLLGQAVFLYSKLMPKTDPEAEVNREHN